MKILVIRLSSIGDVVHTTPMVAALIGAGHEVACVYSQPPRPAGGLDQFRHPGDA